MNTKLRIYSLALALSFLMTLFVSSSVLPAVAETSGTTGDCTWTLDGTVLTISGNGAMEDYDFQTNKAPWGTSITKVVIEEGVTNIGRYAFIGCTALSSVVIPNSVVSIGTSAFESCVGLASLKIPDSVECIESAAFAHCIQLTSVVLPDGVTSIEKSVFSRCTGLISVTLGDNVTNISVYAFYKCANLASVTVPKTVTSIGDFAFDECDKITIRTFSGSVAEEYAVKNNIPFEIIEEKAEGTGLIGDCNGDGVVDAFDVALLAQYVAGWDVSLGGTTVQTGLPKLYLSGNMDGMSGKKDVRNISAEFQGESGDFSAAAKIKFQGSSSMAYEKKNFTINFYTDSNYTEKLGVDVGWGKQNEYCLKANWIDKTHSRNIVTARLASEVQAKYGLFDLAPNHGTIDGFPLEIYINGEYHGLYTMNIPKDAWMFNMDKENPNHIVIGGENWEDPVNFKEIPTDFSVWEVEVGEESEETLRKVQRLVSFVKDSTDEEFVRDFEQYLNLDSTLNYYVMMQFGYMPDNRGKNMLLVTYDGNVWYPSLYDLDTTWGVDYTGESIYPYETSLFNTGSSVLWNRLETLFKKEIAIRYFELRESVLDVDHIMELFYDFNESIPKAAFDREAEKWDSDETPIPGYDLWQIEHYLNSVAPRMDAKYAEWLM